MVGVVTPIEKEVVMRTHPATKRIALVVLLGVFMAAIFVAGSVVPQAAGADADEVPVTVTFMRYIEIENPDPLAGPGDYYLGVCWERRCDVGQIAQLPNATTAVYEPDNGDVQPFSTLTRTYDRNVQATALVNLQVWDRDPSVNSPDDVMDINPVDDRLTLTFSVDLNTGSWTETSGAILPNVGFAEGDGDTNSASSPWYGPGGEAGKILFDISLSDDGDGDDDGIPDGVERTGVRDRNGAQVANMAVLGADPCRKTVAVEMDFMESQGIGHSHRPQSAAITEIQNAFKSAPVPSRSPCPYSGFPKTDPGFSKEAGINLILDEDDPITEQSTLPGASTLADVCGALDTIRASFFQLARRRYFHYMVWAHDLAPGLTNGGAQCRNNPDPYGRGTDFVVTLGSWANSVGTVRHQSGGIMHELGHALGLGHGGVDAINFKPNYLSVMNYSFAATGIRAGAVLGTAPARIDYSRQELPALDETALSENAGIGDGMDWTLWFDPRDGFRFGRGDGALDWNFSSGGLPPFNATPVAVDVNGDTACVRFGRDGTSDTTVAGDDTVATAGNPPVPVSPIRVGPNGLCDSMANSNPSPMGSTGDDGQVAADQSLPCVLPGADGIDTWWQGDDRRRWSIQSDYYIDYGPNRRCDTKADAADIQATPVGQSVPTIPLAGFDDWANLRYSYSLGNIGAPPSQGLHADMTYEEALENEAFWQDAGTVPTAKLAPAQTLTGPVTATFSEPVRGVTDQNFVLRLEGTKADLPANVSCRDGSGADVACDSKEVSSADLAPADPLVPGEHYEALVSLPGAPSAITDSPGNAVVPASAAFRASQVEDERSVAAEYTWQPISDAKALGGSYDREHLNGATASYRFRGGSVTWFAVTGPDGGLADAYVDGVLLQTVDLYSPTTQYGVAQSIGGLNPDLHTLTIRVVGATGTPASKDTFVAVDAVMVDDDKLDDTPAFDFRWQPSDVFEDISGRYVRSDLSDADVEFTFRGRGITWFTVKGPDQGSAELYVDGVKHSNVSNYAATRQLAAPVKITGLSDAVHTLRIVVPPYASRFVSVDGWRVH